MSLSSFYTDNPLVDKDFLKQLDTEQEREVFAKIISLDLNERPIEEITGRVTGGSINVDGNSSSRRTCSLTLVASELNIHDYYWGLKTKFQLFIGLKNKINPKYPEIVWFKQGTFVISSFSTQQQLANYTINIQGKDKMSQLNGELGGTITSLSWDFGQIEDIDEHGSKIISKYLIKDIITEAVHEHAKEPYYNIIINDLEDEGLELLEYKASEPLFLIYDTESEEVAQLLFDVNSITNAFKWYNGSSWINTTITYDSENDIYLFTTGNNTHSQLIFDERISMTDQEHTPTKFRLRNNTDNIQNHVYTIIIAQYGDVVGYRITDLVYAGDLIANVGDAVTSILDKIVKMLGDYEYFYNLEGQFIFQRKKTYLQQSLSAIIKTSKDDDIYVASAAETTSHEYSLTDSYLVSAFTNTPNFQNIKNDFSIWGSKKSLTGKDISVHLRYAIDKKPFYYKAIDGTIYATEDGIEYYNSLSEKTLSSGTVTGGSVYKKTKVPADEIIGLSEDWWDVFDWGAYYYSIVGTYPSSSMMYYQTEPFVGLLEFPDGKKIWCGPMPESEKNKGYTHIASYSGALVFDVYKDTADGHVKNTIYSGNASTAFMHTYNGCGHSYNWFIESRQNICNCYIYKPQIPSIFLTGDALARYNDTVVISADDSTVYQVDWREIIYQMMADKRKYQHNSRVMNAVKLTNNNFNSLIQYYIYNTSTKKYESIDTFSDIELTQPEYNTGVANGIIYYKKTTGGLCIQATGAYDINAEYCILNPTFQSYLNDGTSFYTFAGNFSAVVDANNIMPDGQHLYENGITGYEQYYVDIEGFWRDLYDLHYSETLTQKYVTLTDFNNNRTQYYYYQNCADLGYMAPGEKYYYQTTDGKYRKFASNVTEASYLEAPDKYYLLINCTTSASAFAQTYKGFTGQGGSLYYMVQHPELYTNFDPNKTYYVKTEDEYDKETHWNYTVSRNPEGLTFWFDFLDTSGELSQYGANRIGDRTKAEKDDKVKSIYFRDTPTVIFVDENETQDEIYQKKLLKPGYTICRLPDYVEHLFNISSQGKSAIDKLDGWLYDYAYCTQTVSITALPIYYLEPNTRIFVYDENSGINGEYIINKLTIPLTYNGTMNIAATKVVERIY